MEFPQVGRSDGSRFGRFFNAAASFFSNQSGASLVFTALALPVVFGMAGLGFDTAIWYMEKRQNQTVADNAALRAVIEMNRDPNMTIEDLKTRVWQNAKRNGFDTAGNRRIIVNTPPMQGPNAGRAGFIEVLVEEDHQLSMTTALLRGGSLTIQARAVGQLVAFGSHCIVALDETMDKSIEVTGSAEADIDCGIASNSSSDKSIYVAGTAVMSAGPAQTHGDFYVTKNASLYTETPPQSLSERVEDPYAERFLDADFMPRLSGGCVGVSKPVKISGTQTLDPNYDNPNAFCGGLKISSKADVFFNPGVYVIDNGDFSVSGKATVRGEDVTIILTAWEPGEKEGRVGNVKITGRANVELSAPTVGSYAGLLFVIDPEAPAEYKKGTPEKSRVAGTTTTNLTGVVYTPNREISFAGNTDPDFGGAACTMLIANNVTLTGNSYLTNDLDACYAAGVELVSQTRVRIVE